MAPNQSSLILTSRGSSAALEPTRSAAPRASLVDDDGDRIVNPRGRRELAAGTLSTRRLLLVLEVALTGAAMAAVIALAFWGEILVAWLGGAR